MSTQNESSAVEHLELLRELVSAGEDPRTLRWAGMRIRVAGTQSQIGLLNRIEERAAAQHDRAKGAKKETPRSAADEAFDAAMGIVR